MDKPNRIILRGEYAGKHLTSSATCESAQKLHRDCCELPAATASLETLKRAGIYLSLLRLLKIRGKMQVQIPHIADQLNLEIQNVEADFSAMGLGMHDQPAFDIESVIDALEERLGFQNYTEAFLVGAGKLGTSLMMNKNLGDTDLKIVAAFDNDPRKIGANVGLIKVMSPDKISSLAWRMHISMGIIATPAGQAQLIADMFVAAKTRAIWNFSADEIVLPTDMILQNTRIGQDLNKGYQSLVAQLRKRSKETAGRNLNPGW